jgi:1-acyl-sn-glycerol-3-phosphate acyltransferase
MPDARIIPIGGNEGSKKTTPVAGTSGRSAGGGRETVNPSRSNTRSDAKAKDADTKAKAGESTRTTKSRAQRTEESREYEPLPGNVYDPPDWDERAASALAFLRRRVIGDYELDEFGFDPELQDKVLMAPFRPLYEKWFRVETRGLENVPDAGGALVVANHSGTIAVDSVMTQVALLDHHPAKRRLRMLGADLVFETPFVGEMARKSGSTLACSADADRLLAGGNLVGVWPEGFKGVGKPFSERYKLQRFGRGGFVAAPLKAQVPIIPTAIVGAEEIYPMLGDANTLARLLGLPFFPLTPTFPWLGPLGMVPLPSKWIIMFGEPIHTDDYPEGSEEDPMLVFNLTDQVRETIQQQLYRLLVQRRSVFF